MDFKDFYSSIDLPTHSRSGRIVMIDYRYDPIRIEMSDGTSIAMTLDQYRKIKGKPKVGGKIEVEFLGPKTQRSQAKLLSIKCL